MQSISINVGRRFRIEFGPALKEGIATEELLHDANTEKHYTIGTRDARGTVIRLGYPMAYLDYKMEWVWYVFELDKKMGKWAEKGVNKTKEEAYKMVKELKGGGLCSWLIVRLMRFWRTLH